MKLCVVALLPLFAFAAGEEPKLRLPGDVEPVRYELDLNLTPAKDTFNGTVAIDVQVKKPTPVIWLNSSGLTIASAKVGGAPAKVVTSGTEFIGLSGEGEYPA